MGWKNPPSNFSKTVEADTENHAKNVSLKVLRNLVIDSPVDEGLFVANWRVGLGKPNRSTVGLKDPSRSTTVQRGAAVVKRFKARLKSIWVSNNLPYGPALNNGHSGQAPKNFVQKAIAKAKDK